jgi:hypothetical protein
VNIIDIASRYQLGDAIRVYITGQTFKHKEVAGQPLYFTGTLCRATGVYSGRFYPCGFVLIKGQFMKKKERAKIQFRKIPLDHISKIELELGEF